MKNWRLKMEVRDEKKWNLEAGDEKKWRLDVVYGLTKKKMNL